MNLFRAWVVFSSLTDWLMASRVLGVRLFGRQHGGAPPRNSPPHPGLRRVALAAFLTALFFTFKLIVLGFWPAGVFGAMTLAYADVAVVVPLLGLAVLRHGKNGFGQKPTPVVRALGWLALVPAPLCAYATFIEPYWLVVETATIEVPASRWRGAAGAEAPVRSPVKVAVLADVQTSAVTDYERRVVQRLMSLEPDIILVAGDLFTGTDAEFAEQLPAMRALLAQLRAPGGVYAVEGDTDDRPRWLEQLLAGTGIRLLRNDVVTTRAGGLELTIGGVELQFSSPAGRQTVQRLSDPAGTDARAGYRILLAHRPDAVLHLPRRGAIDLVVAGHTHGGQVQIPGFGPLITFTDVPRSSAGGGLSVVNGYALDVSRGVGHERQFAPRIRLFCRPEISLLTLQPN